MAFSECHNLTSVTIPNSVTDIDEHAFSYCNNLMSVTIGTGVKSISSFAFYCQKLVEVINYSSLNIQKGYSEGNSSLGWFALEIHSGDSKIVNKDGYCFYTIDNKIYLVNYLGSDKDIHLPANFNGKNYRINNNAFHSNKNITSVTIPDSVTSIGDDAFNNCTNLTDVTIGNSVTNIGASAFSNCISLMSITIPNSVKSIGTSTFSDCDKLIEVINKSQLNLDYLLIGSTYVLEIHSGDSKIVNIDDYLFYTVNGINYLVNYIGANTELMLPVDYIGENYTIHVNAFCNNTNLTSIVLPNNSTTGIYKEMFSGCANLKNVTIPESVTYIGESAFDGCYNLTNISISDSVTRIHTNAFLNCNNLENVYITDIAKWCSITFRDNPLIKANNLYLNGTLVTNLVIPDSVTSISQNAFYNYKNLISVTIGNNVTNISDSAFSNCTELMSVTIGKNVTKISANAFYNCHKLVEIINKSSLSITTESSNINDFGYYSLEVHTGDSKIVDKDGYYFYTFNDKNYLVNYLGSEKDILLPSNFNGETYLINNYAFCGNGNITSVTIPDSVTNIGNSAFLDCSALTSVSIGTNVITIGESAFRNCAKLTSVTIPDSVINIGTLAFSGCTEVTSISIGNGITNIPVSLFSGCDKLSSVSIGNRVTSIGIGAFNGCASLTSINFRGTEEQWNSIKKGTNWDSYTGNYTITYNYTGE